MIASVARLSTAPVVELSGSRVSCALCDALATWRVVGTDRGRPCENRSCGRCLSGVAESTPTDDWLPLTLHAIFPNGATA